MRQKQFVAIANSYFFNPEGSFSDSSMFTSTITQGVVMPDEVFLVGLD